MSAPIDQLLLQIVTPDRQDPGLLPAAQGLARLAPVNTRLRRAGWSDEAGEGYAYLALDSGQALQSDAVRALEARLQGELQTRLPAGATIRLSRLQQVFDAPGHSLGRAPSHHYVVEMDPEDGWMGELTRWYDTEHMPGLAAVPGTVRALRLLNHDHGPLSLACYDLDGIGTFESPPWLAVRGTAWSSQMRPHFRNTKRTMMRVLA